ncbi:MAG: rRNA maturation RNase YbeY [Rhodocyclaceae bacterium]|nr:rRNA maturation RNase YbeY [Rhodocyclaceae bacterium]
MGKRLLELALSVQYACKDAALPLRPQVRRWVRAAQEHPVQATIRFVDAEEGRSLNRDWRGKDTATNVLSFPYEIKPAVMGDLAICVPVVLREAQEQGKPAEAHFAHLIVHGMLHLQGYDHEIGPEDAERMEVKERTVLAHLGYADPY